MDTATVLKNSINAEGEEGELPNINKGGEGDQKGVTAEFPYGHVEIEGHRVDKVPGKGIIRMARGHVRRRVAQLIGSNNNSLDIDQQPNGER